MSEQQHPGFHLDADTLSAFIEGMLPEHERAQCLAHLAECSRCREVVFLAQDTPAAPPAVVHVPTPVRPRWFRPQPHLAAAAVVCVALLGGWLYFRSKTGTPPRELVAQSTRVPSTKPHYPPATPAPKTIVRKAPRAPGRNKPERKGENRSPGSASAIARTATSPTTTNSSSSHT